MALARRTTLAVGAAVAGVFFAGAPVGGVEAQEDWLSVEPRLPAPMLSAAAAYQSFTNRAEAISPAFSGPDGVKQALEAAAPLQEGEFEQGMVAWGALAALGDERFVEAVRREGQDPELADRLSRFPTSVLQIDGAAEAAGRVEAALSARAQSIETIGQKVKAASYSLQSARWSKLKPADGQVRLRDVEAFSQKPLLASLEDEERTRASAAREGGQAPGLQANASPAVVDALALAALAALGDLGAESPPPVAVADEDDSAACLRMARLNLYQCLAAAGPEYEDVYCLGEHALKETGSCLASSAGLGSGEPPLAIDAALSRAQPFEEEAVASPSPARHDDDPDGWR
ncbi:MAG: hypothetical protein ACRED8_02975 [Caulobacteraceae bacterium]